MDRRVLRVAAQALLVTGILLVATLAATPATAASAAVSGVVSVDGAVPGEPVEVIAHRLRGERWNVVGSVITDASGGYALEGLRSGTYRIEFDSTSNGFSPPVTEFFADSFEFDDATSLSLAPGQVLPGIDADMVPGALIQGHALDDEGDPLSSAQVSHYQRVGDTWIKRSTHAVDGDGSYEFIGLAPGEHRIGFIERIDATDLSVPQFWQNAPDLESATTIAVTPGQVVSDIDARLVPVDDDDPEPVGASGSVSGRVANRAGVGLGEVRVVLKRFVNGAFRDEATVSTAASGEFFVKVPPGTYRVFFWPVYGSPYVSEYYDDSPTSGAAEFVEVVEDEVTAGIDAVLDRGATLRGTVTPSPQPGASGVTVFAYQLIDGDFVSVRGASVEGDGSYEIPFLSSGTYRIQFQGTLGLFGEYYDDAADLESATDVTLAPGQTRVIDAELASTDDLGSISGTVQDVSGEPVFADVDLYQRVEGHWSRVGTARTDAAGRYTLGAPAGTFRLGFDGQGFHRSFWNGATTIAGAQDIFLEDGMDATGYDATLVGRSSIGGTMLEDDRTPVSDGFIILYRDVLGEWVEWGRVRLTDERTKYRFSGLPPGRFRVEFRGPDYFYGTPRTYFGEFWPGAETLDEGQDIVLGQVEDRDGVDGYLTPVAQDASLSGTAIGEAGETLDAVKVELSRREGDGWVDSGVAFTDSDGRWTVDRLRAGSYRIFYVDTAGDYAATYFGGASDETDAQTVTLAAAEQRAGIDQRLQVAGEITGTARDASGAPVASLVVAYRRVGAAWVPDTYGIASAETGRYQIDRMTAGTYRLRFKVISQSSSDLADTFWGGAGDIESGATLEIVAGERREDITHTFPVGGEIRGRITLSGGDQQLGRGVRVHHLVNGRWEDEGGFKIFGVDGSYRVQGLADGRYRIVSEGGHTHRTTWWGGATNQSDADVLSLGIEEVREGIDIDLPAVVVCGNQPARMIGRPQVGSPITVFPGTWETPRVEFAYAWYVGGELVEDATTDAYIPREQDAGQSITATVTASRSGFLSTTVHAWASGPVVFPALALAVTELSPRIVGSPRVGESLSANVGSGHPSDTTFSYRWAADGQVIPGATGATFIPAPAHVGRAMTVLVRADRAGYAPASAVSPGSDPVGPGDLAAPAPRIVGSPQVGEPLSVTLEPGHSPDTRFGYIWAADGRFIPGARSATFTPGPAQRGRSLVVLVTADRDGYATSEGFSSRSARVSPGLITVRRTPRIVGRPKVSKRLSVRRVVSSPSTAVRYRWFVDGRRIKARGRSLRVRRGYAGKRIQARVLIRANGYSSQVLRTQRVRVRGR